MFPTRLERGAGLPADRADRLRRRAGVGPAGGLKHLVLVDAKAPVSFFAYPGKKSYLVPDGCEVHELAGPAADVVGSLEALAEALGASGARPTVAGSRRARSGRPAR